MKKTILVLLLIFLSSAPLTAVKGQGTYILITENGVEGSDNITQEGNIFTIIEPIRNPIKILVNDIVLDGDNNKMEVVTSYDAITLTGRNNVIVKNIRINIARNGIVLESSNMCTIQNCTIKTGNDGIRLTDASTQNIILENTIMANERVGVLLKEQSNDNAISGNIINENLVGIAFEDSHRNEVFDNQINGNTLDGIHSDASNENLFHHNVANENDQGLALRDGSTNNQVYDNMFNYNLDNGIDVDESDNNRLYDNEMGYNIDYGIDVDVCTLNHFYQNNIHDNRGGIDFDQAEGNYIYSNNFVENRNQVTYDSEKNHWNTSLSIGGNYWSDYVGEDLDGNGFGDASRYFRSIIIGGVETIDTDNLDYYPLMHPFRRVSAITCSISSPTLLLEESILISGTLDPALETEISLTIDGPDDYTETLPTDLDGGYTYAFSPDATGTWTVQTSWAGDIDYHSTESKMIEFTVEAPPPEPIPTKIADLGFDSTFEIDTTLTITGYLYTLDNSGVGGENVEVAWVRESDHDIVIESVTLTTKSSGMFTHTFTLDESGHNYILIGNFAGKDLYLPATEVESPPFEVGMPMIEPTDEPRGIPGFSILSIGIAFLMLPHILQKNIRKDL